MFRILKLIVFLVAAVWAFKYHHDHRPAKVVAQQGRTLADGQYSSASAASSPHVIVYGIPCVQTRNYTGMLDRGGIPYLYKDINQAMRTRQYKADILPRMAASHIAPQDVKGPLVDINGTILMMPDIATIRAALGGN